jgi:hypothetical protein
MENQNQSPQTPQNPNGHPAAGGTPGSVHVPPEYGIGAFNTPGMNPEKAIADIRNSQNNGQKSSPTNAAPPQGQPAQGNEEMKTQTQQPSEKDRRHFAQEITKAAQDKYDIARLAVETDENAIYKIAEKDADLATRLLKEFDFGVETVTELLDRKTVDTSKNPEQVKKEIEDNRWKKDMESRLLDSEILRIKAENPEITGEAETKLREFMSDSAMDKFSTVEKVNMARAITTKESQQNNADNVAIALLSREEGMVSAPKGAGNPDNTKQVTPEMKQMLKAAGMTEKDLDVLPSNINEMISQMYGGPLIGR